MSNSLEDMLDENPLAAIQTLKLYEMRKMYAYRIRMLKREIKEIEAELQARIEAEEERKDMRMRACAPLN